VDGERDHVLEEDHETEEIIMRVAALDSARPSGPRRLTMIAVRREAPANLWVKLTLGEVLLPATAGSW